MKPALILPLSVSLILFLFPLSEKHMINRQQTEVLNNSQSEALPRIAIAGIATESSTFSPAVTEEDDFRVRRGTEVLNNYPFLSESSQNRGRAEWFPAVVARTSPGGAVTRETYESLVEQTLKRLAENLPYDGLFLDLHGAMSVEGLDDPEGDYIARIREVVGKETLISTSMDLHGNVSWSLAKHTDLITCYRMAPHEDALESKQRAVENLLTRLESGKGKPAYKAWIPVPILLPGEKTSTRVEPAKSLYAQVEPAAQQEGVIDAAIWIGYAWADEPRNHAVVMVTGDDKETVTTTAEELANNFWEVRSEFDFVAPTATLHEALDKAVASDKDPFFISDMGDNPTAGGAGDVTWTLREILNRPEFKSEEGPSLIYASIPGPELVEKVKAAGVGEKVKGTAGAIADARFGPPIQLEGTVQSIGENAVVLKMGSVQVIVNGNRNRNTDFEDLDLNPTETDIVVVKMGYLVPRLYDMSADWIMALTPGGVDQDIEGLDYRRIQRPMFPFDRNMSDPNLKARLIPSSEEYVPDAIVQ